MYLDDLIGQRVNTGYGYGEIIDVTDDEEFIILLDDGSELRLSPESVDVVDFDEGPEDDADDLDDDFEGDEREVREEFGDDFEEDV